MTRVEGGSWMRGLATRSAFAANCRFEQRYAEYPHYAVLLAIAVWLFRELPADSAAMSVVTRSPLWLAVVCAVCVAGSALAGALGLIGVWRPGRTNVAFSVAALALCCMPWV